jgi:hypothetical protein
MNSDRDTTRIVRSWLRTDERESATRVLDNVLAVLDTTPQRRSSWPVRRVNPVNTYTKFAIAAAAVLVVAVVGLNLLPSGGSNVGGPAATPSPSVAPSVTPSATPTNAPSPTLEPSFLPDGPVSVGRHAMVREGVRLSIDIDSPGWTSGAGVFIDRGDPGEANGSALVFWDQTPDNVYSDPCGKIQLDPAPDRTAIGLAAAVSRIPGTVLVSAPRAVTVGGMPAQFVATSIPEDIRCAPDEFFLWTDEHDGYGGRYATVAGMVYMVWIVDVDGKLVWIDGETYTFPTDATQELEQIVDSIRFE